MNDHGTGARGFSADDYRARTARAQSALADQGLAALLLTTEPDVRYFTGFLTRFWESPTRPWFVIVPASGDPIAVIPDIGAHLMGAGWILDIRTWSAPDYEDDGVGLLADALSEVAGKHGRIGMPQGIESHLRMPLADFERLQTMLGGDRFVPDGGVMRDLRLIKSEAEIRKIRTACGIADRAFDRVSEIATAGVPLDQVFRRFQMLCLDEGADWVSYLAGGAGRGGYGDVISPATPAPLQAGDVLMLDTGLVHDGYFCDFDRNFAVGAPDAATKTAHARLIDATFAGFDAARVGRTTADIFHAMDAVLTGGTAPDGAGRLGHGLGMQLTEFPSLIPADHTSLRAGIVLTLEPGIDLGDGRILVHEENIVIRDAGAEWLSSPAGHEMMQI